MAEQASAHTKPQGSGWREPTTRIPLRWGRYRARYLAALILILAGGLLVQATSAYATYLLVIGLVAHLLGWWILPSRGWRRLWASLLSALIMLVLLTGGPSSAALVLPLAGWLLARQRPARSYIVLIAPVATGIVLGQAFPQYGYGAIVLAIAGVVLVGSSWLARLLANNRQTPRHEHSSAG
ncbi:MAG: hypothetical protein ABI053_01585 [Lacisediminihabitans sp.]